MKTENDTPAPRLAVPRLAVPRLATLALAAAVGISAHADDSGGVQHTAIDLGSGAQTYAHICQGCHMAQGEGAVGAGHYPTLAGDPALVSWQYVALTVLNGKNGMPAFGAASDQPMFSAPHLNDAQVAEVVNYVRSHFGNHWKDKATAEQVAALPHPR